MQWTIDIRDGAPATANKHRRHVVALWKFAHKRQLVAALPEVGKAREPKRLPVAWTPAQVGKLLHAAGRLPGRIGHAEAPDFWRALILAAYDTGARRGVLLNLPPKCWRPDASALYLPAALQKQDADQVVGVSVETAQAIARIYQARSEFLFCWPFDRYKASTFTAFYRAFRKLAALAGLDTDDGAFHRLRRTRATLGHMVSPGSATPDLGHSSAAVTRGYIDDQMIGQLSGRARVVDQIPRPRPAAVQSMLAFT